MLPFVWNHLYHWNCLANFHNRESVSLFSKFVYKQLIDQCSKYIRLASTLKSRFEALRMILILSYMIDYLLHPWKKWKNLHKANFLLNRSGTSLFHSTFERKLNVRSAYNLLIINLADLNLSRDYYMISVDLYKLLSFQDFFAIKFKLIPLNWCKHHI